MMKLIIDADTGSDDAVALVMALNNSKISIKFGRFFILKFGQNIL